jgi:hypothetical protein
MTKFTLPNNKCWEFVGPVSIAGQLLGIFLPLEGPLFRVTVFSRQKPEEQPSLSIVNVVGFITLNNFELLFLPPLLKNTL